MELGPPMAVTSPGAESVPFSFFPLADSSEAVVASWVILSLSLSPSLSLSLSAIACKRSHFVRQVINTCNSSPGANATLSSGCSGNELLRGVDSSGRPTCIPKRIFLVGANGTAAFNCQNHGKIEELLHLQIPRGTGGVRGADWHPMTSAHSARGRGQEPKKAYLHVRPSS